MNLYLYDGPVMEFDNCVANRWTASTRAVSEKKARSNLTYQFKKKKSKKKIPSLSEYPRCGGLLGLHRAF